MQRVTAVSVFLASLILLSALFAPASFAQSERERRQRPGKKAGEVITSADRSERWSDRLAVGGIAPEFSLPLLHARDQAEAGEKPPQSTATKAVTLSELRAERPVVLIFGSITCPPFRGQLEGIERVYQQFQDRAEFLFVYIREAHPDSVLSVVETDGSESLRKISQPVDLSTRTASAAVCQRTVDLSIPVAIDTMDNAVGRAYAGWPNRMVVVGADGRIIYLSDPAAGATKAQRLRAWLEEYTAPHER